jgi:pimeloyl-ACP methyl ester carboxylesterase
MEAYWHIPKWREGVERLAGRRLVVHYDPRGYGLSQREVNDLSLEARVNDLAAVVDRLGATEVDLLSYWAGAAVDISYAVTNPERVRRLILRNPVARGRDMRLSPLQRAMRPLVESEWETYIRTLILDSFGWEVGSQIVGRVIEGVTPDTFVATGRAAREYDVTGLLPNVRCPTLLIRSRTESSMTPLEIVKHMAAAIPNARLVQHESESPLILADGPALRIIEEFLDEGAGEQAESVLPEGTAIILFAETKCRSPHRLTVWPRPVTERPARCRTSGQPSRYLSQSRGFGQPRC